MRIKLLIVWSGIMAISALASWLRADVVEMQNGDRYSGKVLAVSADNVVLASDVLGKINVPRKNVTRLSFGTNAAAPSATANVARISTPANINLPVTACSSVLANTNVDLSAELRHLGANTNFVGQIRQQMLAGSPEAADKYDEMVGGLVSGKLNLDDVRREARSSADQLRALKHELGPDADESLDGYLQVLDGFLKETNTGTTANTAPKSSAP